MSDRCIYREGEIEDVKEGMLRVHTLVAVGDVLLEGAACVRDAVGRDDWVCQQSLRQRTDIAFKISALANRNCDGSRYQQDGLT